MKVETKTPLFPAEPDLPTRAGHPAFLPSPRAVRHRWLRTAGLAALASVAAEAAPLLAPGDPVFAYDLDTLGGNTGSTTYIAVDYPPAESPAQAIDGSSGTKYLNRSKHSAGIIVTPATAAAAQSMVLTTANDSAERDPSSYIILGSNQPITSTDRSNGFNDHWTFIAQGTLSLPAARLTTAAAINFTNTTSYSSYWIVFPTVKDAAGNNLMQIAEIQLHTGAGGTGDPIFSPGNPALCTGWNSSVANGEFVTRVVDGNPTTKYLNFGENNSGFFVVPGSGRSIVESFQLTTANDSDVRDPATWELHGRGVDGIWSLIDSGSVALPTTRGTAGPVVVVNNPGAKVCTSYRMTFPTVRNAAGANSMQVAEAQLFGIILPTKDTDSDQMDDDWELLHGLTVGVNDSAEDVLDQDGSSNLQEFRRGTLPNNPDTDGDDLLDGDETGTGVFVDDSDTGTNPLNPDTDGDTYRDGYEVAKGTNPNAAASVPTILWDTAPGAAGPGDSLITGGGGVWDDQTTANWTIDNGANNVPWNNAGPRLAAIFGGTAGTVTLTGPIQADRVIVSSAGYVFNGDPLTLGPADPIIDTAAGITEMAQVIAGTAGFTKQGNGTLRLTGQSNTYTGTTRLKGIGKLVLAKDAGQIAIPGDVFLDSFAFTQNNSGLVLGGDEQIADTSIVSWANVGQADTYFRLNGHTETIGGLVSDGVGNFVVIENRGFGDIVEYPEGKLIVHTTGTSSYFFNGSIRNIDGGTLGGTVAITKSGSGTQVLAGNMSYSGPTAVLGGTLQLNNNLPGSAVTVESGGTLAGSATVQILTVAAGGTVSPGTTGIGTLTAGTTAIAGTYACQIDGTNSDQLVVNGNLDATGATLQLSVVNPPTAVSYVLASHTGTLEGTFNVTGVPAGYSVDQEGGQIRLLKDGFSAWAAALGLSGIDEDDFDDDGLADAVEYVLGTDPLNPNAGGPAGSMAGDNFIFTFQRDRGSMTADITLAIEVSSDLENMTGGDAYLVGATTGSSSAGVTVTDNGTKDTVTLTIPRAPDARKFARLVVIVEP
jgi:autotransporter-associated beta strand protein